MALDERLRRELEGAGRPADPSGVYEDLIGRRERRRLLRQVRTTGVALGVVIGIALGILGLSKVFSRNESQAGSGVTNGRIAFTNFEAEGGLGTAGPWRIYTMRPDGSGVSLVSPRNFDEASKPTFSPDGFQMAFAGFTAEQEGGVYVLDLRTSDISKIYSLQPGEQIDGLAWSPAGERIGLLLTQNVQGPVREVAPPESELFSAIWTISLDGSDLQPVTTVGREGQFSWSPDGSKIVFSRSAAEASSDGFVDNDLYIIRADGTEERRLSTDAISMSPVWSPDGLQIAFESYDRSQSSTLDLYVMDIDGTNRRRLTADAGNEFGAVWSPDGTLVAYSERTADGKCFVSSVKPDGTDRMHLFGMSALEGCPGSLGMAWAPAPVDAASVTESLAPVDNTPSPSLEPTEGDELGLGFPVCNVTSVEGEFAEPSVNSTVFVATRTGDTGGCPQADDAFNVIALDTDRNRMADTSFGPIECELECRAFSSPDLDGDGTAELLVVQGGGSVLGIRLYDFETGGGDVAIVPVNVAEPGDPDALLEPGEQAFFLLGGDAFELYSLRCGSWDEGGPALVVTLAESLPHDSPDAVWHAHEATLVLQDDGLLHVVDARDFTEPVTDDPGGPSFASEERLCGANLGP